MRAFVLACFLMCVAAPAVAFAAGAGTPPHTHEFLTERPSGFWTSNRPAVGGAYRYRLLGLGVIITGVTAFFVVRALRKAGAARSG